MKIKAFNEIHLGKAQIALDLGDGSERGEYVNQDYILTKLGRPHRNIGLMYTYYPYDKEWPERISVACADMEITFQWDYPYDDYFPYKGATGVATDEDVFEQMRDIRRHGQDVTLTLTIDCKTKEEELINIAKELKTFGQMKIRINHECAGDWFTHNQRYSFKEIADFFVKFHKIIKEYAPNITTIFDTGFLRPDGTLEHEDDFMEAYLIADEWSADCYLSLHYGWPFDVAEKDSTTYSVKESVSEFVELVDKTYDRYNVIADGKMRPLVITEFNNDGDVTGPKAQGDSVVELAKQFKNHDRKSLAAYTMYQFRDRGRLGLEIEDPNNSENGIRQPLMDDYIEILKDDFFKPEISAKEYAKDKSDAFPKKLRWGSAEDSDGLEIDIEFEKAPVFCEVTFEGKDIDLNLMMEINGRWFYKAPGVETIDLMPAFFTDNREESFNCGLKIFAPPSTGENVNIDEGDNLYNYYETINAMPKLRIRYESLADIKF
ncbi:MAG: hypothetical protein K6D02_06145 [Lachnospiraceae bacterium]|nr:hypothetical protein [Lachnospiraceae bacterium]